MVDVLIIGGGINGAAVANMAASHGLKVMLVEKGDFAGGTSSKSTKLIHGGLRYLEHFEFDLVYEALKERAGLLKSAPHLVKPLTFVIPVYRKDARPLWMMRLGVTLYDWLSAGARIEPHRTLTADEVAVLLPGLRREGLVGGVTYADAQMDDARLCLENVLSAKAKGAQTLNYVEAIGFVKENGKVVGAHLRDTRSRQVREVRAKRVVCAAGPWTDEVLRMENPTGHPKMRLTKGVHLILRHRITERAVLLQTEKDRRIFFVIPWMGHSLIGTTDTDYRGSPDDVRTEEDDIQYLLRETRRAFPDAGLDQGDIVTTFAGLRPLVRREGSPSRVSRKHVIEESYTGVIYIMGGKYTTYRKIAEDCVRKILSPRRLGDVACSLYGSGEIVGEPGEDARRFDVDEATVRHLRSRYGIRARDVLELTQNQHSFTKRICDCCPDIAAQAVYAIRTEMAKSVEDIVWRRLGIGYLPCDTGRCREAIQQILSDG